MRNAKKALLLVNLGTPDSPETSDVRRYLAEFLNDPRVIDLPWLFRKVLVNLVIVPFRSHKSSELYNRLWSASGSPILLYLNSLVAKLELKLKQDYDVFGAMRYGNPSLADALRVLQKGGYDEITVFPLFPQYASSTTGSIAGYIMRSIRNWQVIPGLRFMDQYYWHPSFIKALCCRIQSYHPEAFDHIVFSYHGLPERQINKMHPEINCRYCKCDTVLPEFGRHCYKAACHETSRLLAHSLNLHQDSYTTAFQSRLSGNWLAPFTDVTLADLASKGCKKVLIIAPSFVADCLETSIEIGEEYNRLFRQHQGHELVLVESLNDTDEWVEAIVEMVYKSKCCEA